ncbi:MAG TPA: FkbM family methyltransferase [Marmoricola sp.]|nr:FkbM family methyltransferase [Marmoricola sp.]
MRRSPTLALRRTRQTLTGFRNGWSVLAASAPGPFGGPVLRYDLPSGLVVRCPNVAGARVPVYEVFVEDAYRVGDLVDGLSADATVLDIGAHIGCFSLAVARALPGARVHAYEASPATAAWLRRNIDDNGLQGRVTAHHCAVAARTGSLRFADNAGGSSLNGLTAPAGTALVDVPSVTLRQALTTAGGPVDLVKIDTEGAEYAMVLAGSPADWASVHRVVIEYHDVAGHDWAQLHAFFAEAGLVEIRREPVSPRQGTAWLTRHPADRR